VSFINEHPVKATRKRAQCVGCLKMIDVGSPAIRWAGMVDGDFQSVAYHPECRAAEIAWNAMIGNDAYDWLSLSEMDREDWPWLIVEHPAAAARKGICDAMAEEEGR
jgi:hypothetical protein